MHHIIFRFWVCLAILQFVGCGTKGPELTPVNGSVTYNGSPLADATILFVANDGRPAQGKSDSDGKFSLTTDEFGNGAVTGMHKVVVTKTLPPDGMTEEQYQETVESAGAGTELPQRKSSIPEVYSSSESTPLQVTIESGGPQDVVLELVD